MHPYVTLALAWIAIVTGGWLGWQLLRQNGRLLLRIEELENRLDVVEFGEPGEELPGEPQGQVSHSAHSAPERADNGVEGADTPYPDAQASRFNNRSLARSKIKRDGLKTGTPAPDFRLPRLDGRGDLTFAELRGKRVLLVFSSPDCGPCNVLAPELEKFHQQQLVTDHPLSLTLSPSERESEAAKSVAVVMISKGEPKDNRAKVKEHGLTFPIVLQQQWEISRRYAMFATPIAYVIDEAGVITHDVAAGVDAIQALLANVSKPVRGIGNTGFALDLATRT